MYLPDFKSFPLTRHPSVYTVLVQGSLTLINMLVATAVPVLGPIVAVELTRIKTGHTNRTVGENFFSPPVNIGFSI